MNSLLEGDNSVIVTSGSVPTDKKQKATTMEISWEDVGGVKADNSKNDGAMELGTGAGGAKDWPEFSEEEGE